MFKLPSFYSIISEFKNVFNRFPLVVLSSIIVTFLSIFLIEKEYDNVYIFNLLIVLILSIPLFISNYLYSESTNLSNKNKLIGFSISFVLLILYYFSIPNNYKHFEYLSDPIISFWIYFVCLHLLVSFITFIKSQNFLAFWEYNNNLFTRISMSLFFSQLLYIGISVALLSINLLFEIKIREKLYFDIGILIFGIFNTCFFLAGIPKKFEIDYTPSIPQYIRSLSQYVLIPIVIVYLVILYLYTGKIVLNMSWPKGGVSYLITACSFIGLLAILLIYPLQKQTENSLLKMFPKFFNISIIPMIIVLFFAIERRIRDYGITENRYLLIVLAFWLLFISIYFLINKSQNIKVIPISLFIISIIIGFGPLSIFTIPYNSQFNRLQIILEKNKILQNNIIYKTDKKLNIADSREISAIVDYLVHRGKEKHLVSLFQNKLDFEKTPRYSKSEKIVKEMGLEFIHNYRYAGDNIKDNKFFSFYSSKLNGILDIKGYDLMLNFSGSLNNSQINIEDSNNKFSIQVLNNNLLIYKNNIKISESDINKFINNLKEKYIVNNKYNLNPEELSINYDNKKIKLKIYFNNLSGNIENNQIKLNHISGNILIMNK